MALKPPFDIMKTDRFADSIRRKLESIRPDFTEKDWARMQSTLHQATPPYPGPSVTGGGSIWAGHPWLLVAATASTVVLMAVSVWQWRQINSLRQTVGQFRQQDSTTQFVTPPPQPESVAVTPGNEANRPDRHQNPLSVQYPQPSIIHQRDTIYITRRVFVTRQSDVKADEGYSARQPQLPPEPRYVARSDKPDLGIEPRLSETKNSNPTPTADDASSTSLIEKNKVSLPATSGRTSQETTKSKQSSTPENRVSDLNLSDSGSMSGQNELPDEVDKTTVPINQFTSLPLSIKTRDWQTALTKRAKGIRSAQPVVVVVKAPEKAPVSQPAQSLSRFRMGVGGAISSEIWSAGVFTELLVGQHITLGLGLSKAAHNNTYINDFDFESRTRRDFRREFARGIDPKRDILNIETRVTRLQLPISVGYRIPLNRSFTLTPSVGTNLNLSSGEAVAFYLPIAGPQRGFDKGTLIFDRSVNLMTNFQLVPHLEWQREHWVVQGGPVFTVPLQAEPTLTQAIPGWPQTVLGARVRLLYQF